MTEQSELRKLLTSPISFAIGGIASVITVALSLFGDPVTTSIAIIGVLSDQAFNLFTAFSVAGFTLAPEFEWLPAGTIQGLALFFGVVIVVKIADSVWDSIKGNL